MTKITRRGYRIFTYKKAIKPAQKQTTALKKQNMMIFSAKR
ncbi:hypothetical protein CSC17_3967 [Klebsiella oxytoca]|nr:hypothetical protein CSC17_3967 [Klebsiella oxytoca]